MNERTTLIRVTDFEGMCYLHMLNLDDDNVYVYDEDEKLIITYTRDCYAMLPDGEIVGKFYLDGGYEQGHWAFEFAETFVDGKVHGLACRLPEGLLDTEVLVTKEFLRIKAR